MPEVGASAYSGSSLTFLDNRYYDPDLGTFTTVDPLVDTTSTPFLYAAGNPTTLSDPSRLSPGDACAGTNRTSRSACARATYDELAPEADRAGAT
jgi:RHS repeat-associated protein